MKTQPKVVLVAEDDDSIREIVSEALSDLGHTVLQVANAAQALEILRESSHKPDLLFTDIKMPGIMDGMELARLVTLTWPRIKLLIASGHFRPEAGDLPIGSRFLPKPYKFAALELEIKALFSEPRDWMATHGRTYPPIRIS